MTHDQLVDRAVSWLRGTMRCGVVLREHYIAGMEAPDAIGWRYGGGESIQVECKVSRADFLADKLKSCRRRYAHLGAWGGRPADHCYYLVPDDLKLFELLPPGWGLLSAERRRVKVIAQPDCRTPAQPRHPLLVEQERRRLVCELRRFQAQGIVYETLAEQIERKRSDAAAARQLKEWTQTVSK